MKQLLILSGKGGTGKTTIASAFVKLSGARAYADCDVDAPNLHLVLKWSQEPERKPYFGLPKAEIDVDKCVRCGKCMENCRFEAIAFSGKYVVDSFACEGCGVCAFVCPVGAVALKPAVAGELMLYRNGEVFSTARLKMGSGTSGLLVTEVKKQIFEAAADAELVIIDGSPGIGCPVIASISGVDMVLVVAEPSVSGISDMERILGTAEKFRVKTAVCVNKFDNNIKKTKEIEDYCRTKGVPFVGCIPYDEEAVCAINAGKSIVELDCAAGKAVRTVYENTMEVQKY